MWNKFSFKKIAVRAAALLISAASLVSLFSCGPKDGASDPPSAKRLLYGTLTEGGFSSPELIFGYGEEEYASRFTSLYHVPLDNVVDGAFAISSGMSADEVTVIRPAEGKEDEFVTVLEDHVHEEISVFEKYSPTDTANLKNSVIFSEGGFVVLIVSADSDAIRSKLLSFLRSPGSLPELPSAGAQQTDAETDAPTTPADVETDAPTTPADTETDAPITTAEPGNDPVVPEHVKRPYCFDNEVPEAAPQDAGAFFGDTVLIGDSRLAGLVLYTAPRVKYDFAFESLSVSGVFTKNLVDDGAGGKTTIMNALKSADFKKVYLMFGVNELGWPYSSTFVDEYRRVVIGIKEINPDADIYVMTMFPTTATYSKNHDDCNDLISERNRLLAEMAKEEGVYLLNTADAVCAGDEFVLPDDLSNDGVHGNVAANKKIRDYILSHYN